MPQDYDLTLNLPKTDFPMRAGLPKREPSMLEGFENLRVYDKLMEKNRRKPLFILHDGPPYANGDIHIGHALNKILKDFIVRYKNMSGFHSPYVPGWDTHGLPIESAILKKNKIKPGSVAVSEFRDMCKAFALDFVDKQREQFKRLGVIGDWDHPYLTLSPEFEAKQIEVFGEMAKKGYIYKGLKPVYWCPSDETALAEAEIEYSDDPCTAIYVKFKVTDDKGLIAPFADVDKTYFLIWTTTTWTLPGNLAISLNGAEKYALVKVPAGEAYIIASQLVEPVMKAGGYESCEILAEFLGRDMEYMKAQHPFYDRQSLIINGSHVTLDTGTGCVHTAPGFGVDDFNVCMKYPEVGITVPVNDRGVMTGEAYQYEGLHYSKANDVILEDMKTSGALFAAQNITHSYPHCWRCKKPIIFRATEQWFASVDAIKDAAVEACRDIKWIPEWGQERMINMIRERSDWCISRQRSWGVPIPIFYCGDCGKELINEDTIKAVSALFRKEGSNGWHTHEADEILPPGTACPHCGGVHFTKETDIMDVWFDSGSTHAAVLDERENLRFPADIYLEGGDQYRGWFQSSLLTSIAVKGQAPYKQIITNGWTVDGEGKAMHKSLGNTVAPEEVIKDYGADILRLWVSSTDYRVDVRISKDILKQLSDIYLKIRNTARYILSNLEGFDPDDQIPYKDMIPLDQWALIRYNQLVKKVIAAYERYEFHVIYHAVHNFCTVEMSNLYLDVLKDRLYCESKDSFERKSGQSAIYIILDGLVRMLAPILAFTPEEIWAVMPHDKSSDPESVLFNKMPVPNPEYEYAEGMFSHWDKVLRLRADVNKALELARSEKIVGKPLDAEITLYLDENAAREFEEIRDHHFTALFIVSKVNVATGEGSGYKGVEFPGVTIEVKVSEDPKCSRCWNHNERVGENEEHPELCPRCAGAVAGM